MSRAEEIKSYLAVQSLGTTTTHMSRQEEEDTQSSVMSMSVFFSSFLLVHCFCSIQRKHPGISHWCDRTLLHFIVEKVTGDICVCV